MFSDIFVWYLLVYIDCQTLWFSVLKKIEEKKPYNWFTFAASLHDVDNGYINEHSYMPF